MHAWQLVLWWWGGGSGGRGGRGLQDIQITVYRSSHIMHTVYVRMYACVVTNPSCMQISQDEQVTNHEPCSAIGGHSSGIQLHLCICVGHLCNQQIQHDDQCQHEEAQVDQNSKPPAKEHKLNLLIIKYYFYALLRSHKPRKLWGQVWEPRLV